MISIFRGKNTERALWVEALNCALARFRSLEIAAISLHQWTRLLVCSDDFLLVDAHAKMTEKRQFRAIKGTRDILPPDSALWNWFERAAREVFESYNFREIRLPIFEETDLFARSIGADTDVVGKEMYTFADRDESSISLRPEATACVVRAYIEHGMQTLPGNVKLYYMGPMFRRERPQKGRYRQFYQIGAEVLGQSDAPAIDAEVIEMLMVLFERAGLALAHALHQFHWLQGIAVRNMWSCCARSCRKSRDKLGADSQRRIETNPLRVLDSKLPEEQPIIETLPRISDHLVRGLPRSISRS